MSSHQGLCIQIARASLNGVNKSTEALHLLMVLCHDVIEEGSYRVDIVRFDEWQDELDLTVLCLRRRCPFKICKASSGVRSGLDARDGQVVKMILIPLERDQIADVN